MNSAKNDFFNQSAADTFGDSSAQTQITRKRRAWGLGHEVGRFMRGYLKREARIFQWAVKRGAPPTLCRLVLLAIKLTCLAACLYTSFWLAIYGAAFWAFIKMAELGLIPDGKGEEENGWRAGRSGFGYYIGGCRVDDEYDD